MIHAPPRPSAPQRSADGMSADGMWEWNGTQWIATQAPPGPQQVAQSALLGQYPPRVPVKKKGHKLRNVGIVVGALLLVGISSALAATTQPTAAATAKASPTALAGPTLTNQQKNAVRSAREYLDLTAFSRQGLIDQLSSAYGSGYSINDATIAVDSLTVDWNAEAEQSAKEYLNLTAFSCNGLIEQLDSPYGGKFTVDQATYGAKQAGAC